MSEFFTQARLLMPVFGILGGLVVFAWSRSLYGEGGGVLSVFLWALCPNILAHTRLVTTDAGATAIGVLPFLFWRYLKHPTWTRAALAGVALGLGQITKFSLLVLYGLWPLLALVALLAGEPIWKSPWKTVLQGLVVVALSVLVIDLGYNFEGVGIPLGRHEFISQTLTRPVPPGMARPAHPDPLLNGAYCHWPIRFRTSGFGSIPSPLPRLPARLPWMTRRSRPRASRRSS
ncbi:MAG: glycosyltransferase family 39 protein [Isosphaeraceae bacterium]